MDYSHGLHEQIVILGGGVKCYQKVYVVVSTGETGLVAGSLIL
jgi:hypothetical protein